MTIIIQHGKPKSPKKWTVMVPNETLHFATKIEVMNFIERWLKQYN